MSSSLYYQREEVVVATLFRVIQVSSPSLVFINFIFSAASFQVNFENRVIVILNSVINPPLTWPLFI